MNKSRISAQTNQISTASLGHQQPIRSDTPLSDAKLRIHQRTSILDACGPPMNAKTILKRCHNAFTMLCNYLFLSCA